MSAGDKLWVTIDKWWVNGKLYMGSPKRVGLLAGEEKPCTKEKFLLVK